MTVLCDIRAMQVIMIEDVSIIEIVNLSKKLDELMHIDHML